ncbi:hypothetical protein DPMN_053654 [Dreissena polymorpha]|uniref:Uncharacterized protein n=1 Tax=Dreissena polymorpha TaxID=45954 RepID=A0A9D4CN19_DREPO|nr:hypothetical protein DPMN_053654 [Dreissena polymorpha]
MNKDIDEHDMYYYQQSEFKNVAQCLSYLTDLNEMLIKQYNYNEEYQYQKSIASEVLVYLLSDMNRLWYRELGHDLSMAYLYKGYSLTIPPRMSILDKSSKRIQDI